MLLAACHAAGTTTQGLQGAELLLVISPSQAAPNESGSKACTCLEAGVPADQVHHIFLAAQRPGAGQVGQQQESKWEADEHRQPNKHGRQAITARNRKEEAQAPCHSALAFPHKQALGCVASAAAAAACCHEVK